MTTLLVICGLSFGFCLILTPIARALAARLGLVDHPDGRRKMHAKETPVAGGVAILLSGCGALIIVLIAPNPLRSHFDGQGGAMLGLLLASLVICALGLLDDFRGLRGRHKLLGQLVAIGIVMGSSGWVQSISVFDWKIDLGPLAAPFMVFWLLGAINSLNLIDGMDGLLSCVGLILSLALAVIAVQVGQWAPACIAFALVGALFGFLRYNFPPASIFLGDSGSMLIGLVLGVLAIQGSIKGPATVALASPLAVLAIPIFDTGAAIIRRKLTGRSIYTTDRGHLHYLLLARGLSSRTVLLFISFLCLVTTVGALASHALKNDIFAIVTAVAVAGVLVVTRLFGHVEYLLVKSRLAAAAGSFFDRDVNGKGQHLEVRLQGSADWNDLWGRLIEHVATLELTSLRLDVNAPAIHEAYHARWDAAHNKADDADLWHADIPLYSRGQALGRLRIVGEQGHGSVGSRIATLASLVDNLEVVVATRLRVGYEIVASEDGRRNGHPHFSRELGLARNE